MALQNISGKLSNQMSYGSSSGQNNNSCSSDASLTTSAISKLKLSKPSVVLSYYNMRCDLFRIKRGLTENSFIYLKNEYLINHITSMIDSLENGYDL